MSRQAKQALPVGENKGYISIVHRIIGHLPWERPPVVLTNLAELSIHRGAWARMQDDLWTLRMALLQELVLGEGS